MYTGTLLHVDPEGTDAFNAVLVGHKWWVVLPKDIYEFDNELSCDEKCSDVAKIGRENLQSEFDLDVSNLIWLKHILPQIRYHQIFSSLFTIFYIDNRFLMCRLQVLLMFSCRSYCKESTILW